MSLENQNAFLRFAALGYSRFVPIVPPDARIYERSTLNRQLGLDKDPRGKTPGLKNSAGEWYGFDFVHYESDDTDLTRWHAMGAGVGIKTGNGLVLIDADTTNPDLAKIIVDEIKQTMPMTSVRIGQYPKAGYLVRTDPDFRYAMIGFGDANERVEILAEGKQFVAHGVHPKTLKPYYWPNGIPAYADLPFLSANDLLGLLERLARKLPISTKISREGAATTISQSALKGGLETVRQAVKAMPNVDENFPRREDYRNVGYAIKAALQDYPHEAFEVFSEWCEDWTGRDGKGNNPDVVASDWRRMQPPYRRGAQWLYEEAERLSKGRFTQAHAWFEDLSEVPLNPFDEVEQKNAEPDPVQLAARAIRPTLYAFPSPIDIQPRQWIYDNHYIRKFVSTTVAPSGVGKSSLKIVEALAMASGKPLLGSQPKGQFHVWLWNGEDPRDELDRRITAAMLHYGLSKSDLEDRLFVDSGRDMEIVIATESKDGARIAVPIVDAVQRAIRDNAIDVLVLDPFVSSHRVSENDNGAIDMVTKQWGKIADLGNCAIELVHHVRKLNGAEITVEDSRGAVSLIATSRSARTLTKMTAREANIMGVEKHWRYFRFGDAKNNLAPPAAGDKVDWLELRSIGLGNGPSGGNSVTHSATGSLDAEIGGDWVGVVCRADTGLITRHDVASDTRGEALRLIGEGEGQWRLDARSPDSWVGVPIGIALGIDHTDDDEKKRLKAIVKDWIDAKILVVVSRKDAQRKTRAFVELAKIPGTLSENLFD